MGENTKLKNPIFPPFSLYLQENKFAIVMKNERNHFSRRAEIKSAVVGPCFLRLTLDARHHNRIGQSPVAISIYIKGQGGSTFYFPLPYKMTDFEYDTVARSTGKGRIAKDTQSLYQIKMDLIKQFDAVVSLVIAYAEHNSLTMSGIKTLLQKDTTESSFLSFWENVSNEKSLGTKESYLSARKSFIKAVGVITGYRITADEIKIWEKGMVEAGLSQTTIGIYFRAFRSVWNSARVKGLVAQVDYPFGKVESKVKIPQGATRKKEYLSVPQMTNLYRIFIDHKYPVVGTAAEKECK